MNSKPTLNGESICQVAGDLAARLREYGNAVLSDAADVDGAVEAYRNAPDDEARDKAVDRIDGLLQAVRAEVLG